MCLNMSEFTYFFFLVIYLLFCEIVIVMIPFYDVLLYVYIMNNYTTWLLRYNS